MSGPSDRLPGSTATSLQLVPPVLLRLADTISQLHRRVLFRSATFRPAEPLLGEGADGPGMAINERLAVFSLEVRDAVEPMYRVVLATTVPGWIRDLAERMTGNRRIGGTLVMHGPEIGRLSVLAEVGLLLDAEEQAVTPAAPPPRSPA